METKYSQLLFHLTLSMRAGSHKQFGGSDSEELFEANKANPATRAQLEANGWLTREFSYHYNAQGFRCDEFDARENFIALGCSFTEGVGVPVEEAWPVMLSQRVGLHCWNLGIGGTSVMSVARLLDPAIQALKPQFVAIFIPPRGRVDVITQTGLSDTYSPMHNKDTHLFHAKLTSSYLKNWFANTKNADLTYKMAVSYFAQIASDYSLPLIMLDGETTRASLPFYRDQGRDLLHDGPKTNAAIARLFDKQIQEMGI